MRVYYCDHYEVELPARHRFPMGKYRQLRQALVTEGVLDPSELLPAPLAQRADLLSVHDSDYVGAFCQGELDPAAVRRIGFPWSASLVQRCLASVGGTLAAVDAALDDGLSGCLAGGTHHAHRGFGSGFCVFNDLGIAAMRLLNRHQLERVLIFDVDVHQGDGTAAIFANDERVFTCSIHGERNFPARKQTSDLDVALPDGVEDEAYLAEVSSALERSLEIAQPQFILLQAGVDALADDRLGRLSLSPQGMQARDHLILSTAIENGVPLVITLGGGYAEPIERSIGAHSMTYRVAKGFFRTRTGSV